MNVYRIYITQDYNPSVPYKESPEAEADTDNDDVLEAELDEAEVDESPGVDGKRKRRSIVASDPKRVREFLKHTNHDGHGAVNFSFE